jgi:glycerol-3-phosphate dehydrogenase (NAD(P)+)
VSDSIGIIGAGAWGTTLAVRLAAERPVTLWTHTQEGADTLAASRENPRYLPGVELPTGVHVTADDAALAQPHRLFIVAVPSAQVRATLHRLAPTLDPGAALLSAVKGIEEHTHLRMSEVIAQELPGRPIAVLSGPNLAREIAAGKPAGAVIASRDGRLAADLAEILGSERFRLYTNGDVIGVELAGALKNVVALAAGMVDGLQLGDSAKAGIITRGLAEITRLGVAAGANPLTFSGLAGVGDLIGTCMSHLSRNRLAGELLASGLAWPDVQPRLPGVAEGVFTVRGSLELADRLGVEMPIAEQVDAVIHGATTPLDAVGELMGRAIKDELAGLST